MSNGTTHNEDEVDESNPFSLISKVDTLKDENKNLERELEELKIRWETQMQIFLEKQAERENKKKLCVWFTW